MKNLKVLFKNLRRLDLNDFHVQDSLYRISDWLSDDEHQEADDYVQNQLRFLDNLIKQAEKENNFFITKDPGAKIIEEHDRRLNEISENIFKQFEKFTV